MSRESAVKPGARLRVIFILGVSGSFRCGCRLRDARRNSTSVNAVRVHRIPVSSHFERSPF